MRPNTIHVGQGLARSGFYSTYIRGHGCYLNNCFNTGLGSHGIASEFLNLDRKWPPPPHTICTLWPNSFLEILRDKLLYDMDVESISIPHSKMIAASFAWYQNMNNMSEGTLIPYHSLAPHSASSF